MEAFGIYEEDNNFWDRVSSSPKDELKTASGIRFLKLLLFETLDVLKLVPSSRQQDLKIKSGIFWTLQLMQYTSLLWYWEMQTPGWSSIRSFWKFIGFARFDLVFCELGLISHTFYVFWGLLLLNLGVFAFAVVKVYRQKKIGRFLAKRVLGFSLGLAYLPILTHFAVVTKCGFYECGELYEYFGEPTSAIAPNLVKGCFSVVGILILILLKCFYLVLNSDQNPFVYNLNSVSCLSFLRAMELCDSLFVILFVLGTPFTLYYLCLFGICCAVLLRILYYLPFFNEFPNKAVSAKYCVFGYLSLTFLVSDHINSSSLVILSVLFVVPLLMFLSKIAVEKRLGLAKKVPLSKLWNLGSFLEFEFQTRPYMSLNALYDTQAVLKALSDCCIKSSFNKEKMLHVWTTYYCFYLVGNLKLAKLKLSQCTNCKSNFTDDYQEFKCHKLFKGTRYKKSEEMKMIKSIMLSQKIIRKNEDFCSKLLEYWAEFLLPKPCLNRLEKLNAHLVEELNKLLSMNDKILEKYPEKVNTIKNFIEFADDFIMDFDLKNYYVKKSNLNLEFAEDVKSKGFSFRSPENGIIVVAGDDLNVSKIIYANYNASEIIGLPVSELLGRSIDEFVPPPYNCNHFAKLTNFLRSTLTAKINLPQKFFLMKNRQELLQVSLAIKVVALSSHPFFVISFKNYQTNSEVALVSKSGLVLCHSKFFREKLNLRQTEIVDSFIQSHIPSLDLEKVFKPVVHDELLVIPLKINVQNRTLLGVLLVEDEDEKLEWLNKDEQHELEMSYLKKKSLNVSSLQGKLSYRALNESVSKVLTHDEIEHGSLPEEPKEESSSTSALCFSQNHKVKRIIKRGLAAIKLYNWSLFVCITVVLVTNCAIIFYISDKVAVSEELGYLEDFSLLRVNVIEIADKARKVYQYQFLGLNDQENLAKLGIMNNFEQIDAIFSKIDLGAQWIQCEESAEFTKTVPIHRNYLNPELIYDNLLNSMNTYSMHTKAILESTQSTEALRESYFYVVVNGMQAMSSYLSNSLQVFVECEQKKVKSLDEYVTWLLVLAIVVLLVCFGMLVWNSTVINNKMHELWNLLRFQVFENYSFLRLAASKRVSDFNEVPRPKQIQKLNFKKGLPFIKRILLFIGVSSAYYLVVYFVIYKNSYKLLLEKPQYLNDYQKLQGEIATLGFWSRENFFSYQKNLTLNSLFRNADFFKDSEIEYAAIAELVRSEVKTIRENSFTSEVSEQTKQLLFEKTNSTNYGYLNSILLYLYETSYFAQETHNLQTFYYLETMYENIKSNTAYVKEFINQDISDMIEYQMTWLIVSAVLYSVCIILMYVLVFRPFLKKETKKLLKLQEIGVLVPSGKKPQTTQRSDIETVLG